MPFQSEKQRRYLHANEPELAHAWEHGKHTSGRKKKGRKKLGRKHRGRSF